mmetsp:Transcript_4610/g.9082  ORF Transcript_4610/g.9082 Transcript_4610/m.9082 type:complete len:385 (+) Transcript_4610:246-1400(+)
MSTAAGYPVVEGIAIATPSSSSAPQHVESLKSAKTSRTTVSEPPPQELLKTLQARGFPKGLSKLLHGSLHAFPLRIWLLDNSGSMTIADGQRPVTDNRGKLKMIKCTRWQELVHTALGIAGLSVDLGARTDFHLLNRNDAGQYLSLDASGGACAVGAAGGEGDRQALETLLSPSPLGTTPLTAAVTKIISLIEPAAQTLLHNGQQVVVVIATDGVPDNPAGFLEALRLLQRLPVWVVVRLCTSDDAIVEYWADLDKSLEAPLEVIDDLAGEAEEVMKVNPWLVYGEAIHHARQFGVRDKLFDLLDETALQPPQIKQLCAMLFGESALPEPEVDAKAFVEAVKDLADKAPRVHDVRSGELESWVRAKALKRAVAKKNSGGGCAIM